MGRDERRPNPDPPRPRTSAPASASPPEPAIRFPIAAPAPAVLHEQSDGAIQDFDNATASSHPPPVDTAPPLL